jgi:hypothetical protein
MKQTHSARRIAAFHTWLVGLALATAPLASVRGADTADASELRLKSYVEQLAADQMEGRGIGTKGLDMAADLIAAEFQRLGLKTDLFDGTPFQKFKVTTGAEMGPAENNRLLLLGPPEQPGMPPRKLALEMGKNFTPLAVSGNGRVEAPLVFVGYGISAKDLKAGFVYDEYEGIDVKGKVVVMIRKEPQQENKDSVFAGLQPSRHALFTTKFSNAFQHGAAAVIVVNDGLELRQRVEQEKKAFADAVDRLVEARKKFLENAEPLAEQQAQHAAEIGKLAEQVALVSKRLTESPDQLLPFKGAGDDAANRQMPIFFCSRETMDAIVKSSLGKDLAAIEREIDANLKPQSRELAGWSASGQVEVIRKEAEVKNVVGVLEGEGPLANETIVIGAHYDHLGFGGAGSLAPWTTDIHNGADDNASGTAALLEIANRLASSGKKPQRRIVFIAFTGEERGLLGSAHYIRQPRFPLENTIAMYNLDMVGRMKDDRLIVYGTGTARHFDGMVEALAAEMGLKLSKQPEGFGPSDHSSFYARKIPVLHFFTGTHSDYHRPSDDADKLNVTGMRRVADMVVRIVEQTDAAPGRPEYIEIKGMGRIAFGDPSAERPSLGTIPDEGSVGDGVPLVGTVPGSPAEKAGLKGGDVLLQLGDSKIATMQDFENALRKHKPGDKVKLIFRRGNETMESEATLTSRRAR